MRQNAKTKRKNITVKQSVVTKVSISLILSFIRRLNSIGVALLSAPNSTNMLPPHAIHALIDLSRGYCKVLFWLQIPFPLRDVVSVSNVSVSRRLETCRRLVSEKMVNVSVSEQNVSVSSRSRFQTSREH
jgi:hypothetical protein